jgi:hypothetical protein
METIMSDPINKYEFEPTTPQNPSYIVMFTFIDGSYNVWVCESHEEAVKLAKQKHWAYRESVKIITATGVEITTEDGQDIEPFDPFFM